MICTRNNWHSLAHRLSSPADPADFNEDSVQRALSALGYRFYIMPSIEQEFKCYTRTRMIDFLNQQEKEFYNSALARYMHERARIEEQHLSNILYLVEDLKLRQAAEELKAIRIADEMFNEHLEGYAPVAGVVFKITLVKIVNRLVHHHGVKPDEISIIWGGFTAQQRKRFAAKEQINLSDEQVRTLVSDGLFDDIIDLYAEKKNIDLSAFDKDLLKTPTRDLRWNHVQRFIQNKTKFAIYTLASGGVALSLHDITGEKPRRTKLGLVYNDKMIPQISRRAHRVNSKSDTYQEFLVYRGTRECRVAERVSMKLRCLRHSTDEDYSDLLWTGPIGEEVEETYVMDEI